MQFEYEDIVVDEIDINEEFKRVINLQNAKLKKQAAVELCDSKADFRDKLMAIYLGQAMFYAKQLHIRMNLAALTHRIRPLFNSAVCSSRI